jgi:hypothetical protein
MDRRELKSSIVEDLDAIAHFTGWKDEEKFRPLRLIRHPLVFGTAAPPEDLEQRVAALREHLLNTVGRIRASEEESKPTLGHRVADASAALLKLDDELEGESLTKVRERIIHDQDDPWLSEKTEKVVSVEGFRQWVEGPKVWSPFVDELLRYADELAAGGAFDPDAEDPGNLDTAEQAMIGRLRAMEEGTFEERMGRIVKDGELMIRHEVEMLKVLQLITDQARNQYCAVDSRPPKEWRKALMQKFLNRQLARVEGEELSLERIYLVRKGGMEDAVFRKNLAWLIKRHEDQSATFRLCPLKAAEDLELSFRPELGLFLADADSEEPLGVTGMLRKGGVGHAVVYIRRNVSLETFMDEYRTLAEEIDLNDYDRELRAELPELDEVER